MAQEAPLAGFIKDAANIASSGRWDALNAVIKRLAANPGAGNDWLVQVLGALCAAIFLEYLQLKRANEQEGESTPKS